MWLAGNAHARAHVNVWLRSGNWKGLVGKRVTGCAAAAVAVGRVLFPSVQNNLATV